MKKSVHLVLGLVAALLLAACSDDGTTEAAENTEAAAPEADATEEEATTDDDAMADEEVMADAVFPAVIGTSTGDVTIEARPERIVSMSSTATEMLFAIGAGEQVVAVDSYSNFPADAPITELSAFEPSLEAIAVYDPDLVLLSFDNPEIRAGLSAIDVPVIVLPPAAVLDDTYDQIGQLGIATGHLDGAAAANADIRAGIDGVLADLPASTGPVRVYHELDDTFFSASSSSFIGQLYGLLGFENIADPADPDGLGFPQLQVDQIVSSDPTLIVFTDAYGYGAEEIAARPGWDTLSAVSTGNILEVDADIASRWGPRVVDFLQLVVDSATVPAG